MAFFKYSVFFILSVMSLSASAANPEVPSVFGYHSAVYDEGGNLIGDGEWNAWFRITDVGGEVLYEERQTVTAVGGRVSALIGNGLTPNGAPTGGIPIESLDPEGAKYLEVEFEGMDPLPVMELATVPYAGYAGFALGAVDGAITYDALADGAVDRMAEEMTGGEGKASIVLRSELDTLYSDTSSASSIGVDTGSVGTSSSNDLQGVIVDFDIAVEQNDAELDALSNALSAEVSNRASADSAEASTRAAADTALDKRVDAVADGSRLSFMRSAWGSVSGGPSPSMVGVNASVAWLGSSQYRINLSPAMPSSNYSAVITPSNSAKTSSPSNAGAVRVYNKTSASFDVQFTDFANESFDFIVMGN